MEPPKKMQTYTARQRKAQLDPIRIVEGKHWFYVNAHVCSFHNSSLNGTGVKVPTSQLIRALRRAGLL